MRRDGRVDIVITATKKGVPIEAEKVWSELLEWDRKAPKFKPDVIPKEKICVPYMLSSISGASGTMVTLPRRDSYAQRTRTTLEHIALPPAWLSKAIMGAISQRT
ncbi:hypothetical protein [Thermococcus sp.]|uniref:hypothetical protein n=1 Tax=Thermococcus sp. TaxID=35749 RepID=UPI00260E9068|nr:hypothetical protein [Thermococcus sp.]